MASEIRFNQEDHSYWIGDKRLESASSLVRELTLPFDKERVSLYCAKKEGVTQKEILDQWEKKGRESRQKGCDVHDYIERVIGSVPDGLESLMNTKIPEMIAFDLAFAKLSGEPTFMKVVGKEMIVGNEDLGVAGRLDLLVELTVAGKKVRSIFDFKTGKLQSQNRFQNLLEPFKSEPDCELTKYSLQLSLYRLMVDFETDDSYLIHLKDDATFQVVKAIDYRERLTAWLKRR